MINYDGRRFRSVAHEGGGQVDAATLFEYRQTDGVVWATYSGGAIRYGTLVATVDSEGSLNMRYHHVDQDGIIATGRCRSTPEVLEDGRVRLHEVWEWTSGHEGSGTSIIEEIPEGAQLGVGERGH